jgi:hypothetical protein
VTHSAITAVTVRTTGLWGERQCSWCSDSPIQWVLEALSPRVKQKRHDADHSHPANAEINKTKHRDNFTFYLYSLLANVPCEVQHPFSGLQYCTDSTFA